jgi:ferric-dicitrate binding protein FerR (iron transport regulator)
MMLDWLAERHDHPAAAEAAQRIDRAVDGAFANGLKPCEFGAATAPTRSPMPFCRRSSAGAGRTEAKAAMVEYSLWTVVLAVHLGSGEIRGGSPRPLCHLQSDRSGSTRTRTGR